MNTQYSFLTPGEKILMEGAANMQQIGGINKGGKLVLTSKRLAFIAHSFNFGSKYDEILLPNIVAQGNTLNIFTPTPNMIKVVTNFGKEYQFVVTKKQRDLWLNAIASAVNAYRANTPEQTYQPQTGYPNVPNGSPAYPPMTGTVPPATTDAVIGTIPPTTSTAVTGTIPPTASTAVIGTVPPTTSPVNTNTVPTPTFAFGTNTMPLTTAVPMNNNGNTGKKKKKENNCRSSVSLVDRVTITVH